MHNNVIKIISVFSVLLICCFVSGCVQNNIVNSLPTISVQGVGKVEAIPDEATAHFGVTSEEKSLDKAYKQNTSSMNSVITAVKSMGIDAKDIKTSSFSVVPIYPRDEKGRQLPGKPATFRVSQNLMVKIRDIEKTGEVIDKVISSGTNVFNGIQFGLSNIEDLQKKSKALAAKNARENALIFAQSLGNKLGKVLKVSESPASGPYPRMNMMSMDAAVYRSAAPQIEAGSMEVTATCSVVYEIIQ